jgi:hypothetical protein
MEGSGRGDSPAVGTSLPALPCECDREFESDSWMLLELFALTRPSQLLNTIPAILRFAEGHYDARAPLMN